MAAVQPSPRPACGERSEFARSSRKFGGGGPLREPEHAERPRPSPRPLYGAPFVKPIFWSSCFFNLLVPFLGSTESRFFVPTCHGSMTPRANAVTDGRRAGGSTSSAVPWPRL